MFAKSSLVMALAGLASAATESLCDKYTTAVFKTNNATNQYLLLQYVVNTALIGNFTPAPTGSLVPVTGILNPGTYNGAQVNLLPYFDGGLASSPGSSGGVAVNFLDGGGAAPLKMLMPATNTSSNQYTLVTHLYSFFGALLGCSTYGMTGFPSYAGNPSMYSVHAFMDLNPTQMGYFISQVGAAAESFGVTTADATTVGMALGELFNYKCLPAANITSSTPELQSICIDPSCPIAANATCSAYGAVTEPIIANASLAAGQGVSSTVVLASSGANTATSAMSSMMMSSMTSSGSMSSTSSGSMSSTSTGTGSSMTTTGSATAATSTPSSFAQQNALPALGAVVAAGALAFAI